jgi:hypothetical protein
MVFGFIAGILSLLSSSIAYIAGAVIFSESRTMLAVFIVALVAIDLFIIIVRMLFSKGGQDVNRMMNVLHLKGHLRKMFQSRYAHAMERKIISGSVARIIAFGTIMYLYTNSMFIAYASLISAGIIGIFLVFAKRHKFVDLSLGVALGLAAGVLAHMYIPRILLF